jgi:biopolymer transport protein ExbD
MKRSVPEINAGSMADIAFLLLIFFLVTTTMDVDTGITRKLPPPLESEEQEIDVKDRNIFKVLVNSADRLLVEDKEGDIRTLKDEVKNFILNPANDENLPEKRTETIDLLGEIDVSRGVVSLKNDRGTSYEMYIKVQNELTAAFREMRDDMSVQYFGVKFAQLVDQQKIDAIQKAIPIAISEAEPEDIGGN